MKTPFTIADGPLAGCSPANSLTVDSGLVGLDPAAGDTRFILRWRRATGTAAGLYRFIRSEEGGAVVASHVPGPDDVLLPTAEELAKAKADAAVALVRKMAETEPAVAAMLKEGV